MTMIYERGNSAKQAILEALEQRFGSREVVKSYSREDSGNGLHDSTTPRLYDSQPQILDLACGDGSKWKSFSLSHPHWTIVGVDTDARAITRGQKSLGGIANVELLVMDAQGESRESRVASHESGSGPTDLRTYGPTDLSGFDVVVAMSAIEHVVDRAAFLKTTWDALKPGGIAFLNYDVGHFRSWNPKERIMVPLSQIFAMFGMEQFYMKRVKDRKFLELAKAQGFRHLRTTKHNLHPLKGFMRGATDDQLRSWFTFEDTMNHLYTPDDLDRVMWSTTVILEKPMS
jgi:2-polyprenyl-3-methyl-5-hydroxy-6-metoxy-1,4-benzoquinol methylase